MDLAEIKALPVRDLAAADAILFLWTIWTMLPCAAPAGGALDGLRILEPC
jgi:N6-adenosine-specific RNA methylase IME4